MQIITEKYRTSSIRYVPNARVTAFGVFIDGEPKSMIVADSLPAARTAAFARIKREAQQ